jgi:peptidyl-prolyl cis-trans isomerase D
VQFAPLTAGAHDQPSIGVHMLERIRERLQGPVAIAIIVIIAVPLAVTFGNMDAGTSGSNTAADVNGEPIVKAEFQRVVQSEIASREQTRRDQIPEAEQQEIRKQALDQLVRNRVVTQFVRDSGFRVGNLQLADHIRKMQAFQVGGAFSQPGYESALAGQGLSKDQFEEEQRAFLSLTQLQDGLLQSAFYTPGEFRRFVELQLQRREVTYAYFDAATLASGVSVSEADLKSFYDANSKDYLSPEVVDLEYVDAQLDSLASKYAPTESELRKAYDGAEPGRFRTDEQRYSRHILIAIDDERDDAAARRLADDLVAKIKGGADFAALAQTHSADPGSANQGGDLGWKTAGAFDPEFEKALFALNVGQVSAPVKTQYGYHIIRLDEIKAGSGRSFDEVRSELEIELRRQRSQDEFLALVEQMDDLALENPNSLEPVAKATGLSLQRLVGFGRNGSPAFGSAAALISAVFSDPVLSGGENTPLIELSPGRAIVARVVQYRAPAPRGLAEVREDVVKRLRIQRGKSEARRRGQALLKQLQSGVNVAVAGPAAGAVMSGPTQVGRDFEGMPAELIDAAFSMVKPIGTASVSKAMETRDGYAVLTVSRVTPGMPESINPQVRDQRKLLMAQQLGAQDTTALVTSLKDAASVSVAKDLFQSTEEP